VLFLGVGNLVWVPLAVKFGKRFSMLTSMAMLFAFLVWTPKANSFNALFAARCLSGLAGGAGEVCQRPPVLGPYFFCSGRGTYLPFLQSLVPGIVSDIFFLHERAAMMAG
jgi:MFS family permease